MAQTAAAVSARGLDWHAMLEDVAVRMSALVPGDLEVRVVVFVGVGTSNGWVTRLTGRATVFLAAELAAASPFDAILAAHELTHAGQHLLSPAWEAMDYPIGAHAFAEGLATYVSELAYPGHGEDEYLWFDSAHGSGCATANRSGPRPSPLWGELSTSRVEARRNANSSLPARSVMVAVSPAGSGSTQG
jgi:hypothetical protein